MHSRIIVQEGRQYVFDVLQGDFPLDVALRSEKSGRRACVLEIERERVVYWYSFSNHTTVSLA